MDDLNRKLKELIIRRLTLHITPEDIGDAQQIFGAVEGGLGLDSIDALDLVVGIFEEFGVEIQQDDMHIFENVNTLAAFVQARMAAGPAVSAVSGAEVV